jgi:hypothetical protein
VITTDDIAGAVLARFAAVDPGWTTLPGKAWFGQGPDDPTAGGTTAGYPYVVFQVEAGTTQTYSGAAYSQTWTVRAAAYYQVGQTGAPTLQAVEQLLQTALASSAAQTALRSASLRNSGDRLLSSRPLESADSKYAPTQRQGQDVFLAGQSVEILVQGDRSNP